MQKNLRKIFPGLLLLKNKDFPNDLGIEIWSMDLCFCKDQEGILSKILNEKERQRAHQFKFDHLRQRYILCHGLLRYLIAYYLGGSPQDIVYDYGPFGKPFIQSQVLHFNMSHSGQRALYAFSQHVEVGVDIEYVNPSLSLEQLPFSLFTAVVQSEILSSSPSLQKEMFYKKWVKMEAFLKAQGLGLRSPFDEAVEMNGSRWNFYDVPLPADYVGAIAYALHRT